MPQYLIIREVADGAARLVGVTEDTTKTPEQIADAWAASRTDLTSTVRLYFADVAAVSIQDVTPRVIRTADSVPVDPAEAFNLSDLINV